MTNEVQAELQQPATDPLVTLYKLDATAIGGSVYYFTNSAFETQAVTFGGNAYTPVAFDSTGWEAKGQGTLPTPRVRISNIQAQLLSIILELDDLLGATITRIRTFRKFLDGQASADPLAYMPLDTFQIERKLNQNAQFVEFELTSVLDQEGQRLPGRVMLKHFCPLIVRQRINGVFDYTNATCPYTDPQGFDVNGMPVPADEEVFSKRLQTCCKPRFVDQPLPFGGFPGLGDIRL